MSPARSHPHGFARILAGCAALLLSAAGFAQSPTPAPTAAPDQDGIVLLPRMTVVGQSLNEFPLFPKADVTPPDFSGTAGPSDLFYPSRANYEGIFEGKATVGVMLDDKGNPTLRGVHPGGASGAPAPGILTGDCPAISRGRGGPPARPPR